MIYLVNVEETVPLFSSYIVDVESNPKNLDTFKEDCKKAIQSGKAEKAESFDMKKAGDVIPSTLKIKDFVSFDLKSLRIFGSITREKIRQQKEREKEARENAKEEKEIAKKKK